MTIKEQWELNKEMLAGKTFKEKVSWFMEYYKWPTIAVICVVAGAASLIHAYVTYVPYEICIMALNTATSGTLDTDSICQTIADAVGTENGAKAVQFDASSFITPGGAQSEMEMAVQEKIITYAASGSLDIFIADAYNFDTYALNGMMTDLRDVLSEEQIEEYEPYFYYVDQAVVDARQNDDSYTEDTDESMTTDEAYAYESLDTYTAPDPSEMQNPVPVGIYYNEAPSNQALGLYQYSAAVLGVTAAATNTDMCAAAVDCLWDGISAEGISAD